MDAYQPIYDAVRSKISNGDSDLCRLMSPLLAALETVANDGD